MVKDVTIHEDALAVIITCMYNYCHYFLVLL